MKDTPKHTPIEIGPGRGLKRGWKRALFAVACLLTAIATTYTVENWRGRHAWKAYRNELEAKGVSLDWSAFVPPPVADDSNFYKAPKMNDWFVKKRSDKGFTNSLPKSFSELMAAIGRREAKGVTNPIVLAVFTVSPNAADRESNSVWRMGTVAAREQATKILEDAIGPSSEGAGFYYLLVAHAPSATPVKITLAADVLPKEEEVIRMFPTNVIGRNRGNVRVELSKSNSFQVVLRPPSYVTAEDYLLASTPCEPDLELLREAAKRPNAQIDCDYRLPYCLDYPNYLSLRMVAQTVAQRADCYLLLHQPEKALRELSLINDLCRILEARPTGKPISLVSAMIRVALTGLYANVIGEGLRLHEWQPAQLVAIQQQLREVDLPGFLAASMEFERTGFTHLLDTTPPGEIATIFNTGTSSRALMDKVRNGETAMQLMPRGWYYQNMIRCVTVSQEALACIDRSKSEVHPDSVDRLEGSLEAAIGGFTPYNRLARRGVPNYSRALQTVAKNQTIANEALIACALERYRMAEGNYPEQLDGLVPQYVEKLPGEVVNGEPLKYRRNADSTFSLWSIGWNLKDEGGLEAKKTTEGDWVWGLTR